MLTLTKKTDYALIAMAHLARQETVCASAREIGDAYSVPLPLLMNILKTLTRSGLIQSVRGARGGYALARPATKITLATLIEVIEGPIRFIQCADETTECEEEKTSADQDLKSSCELMGTCPVRHPAMQVHDRLIQFLQSVTLAELVQSPAPEVTQGALTTAGKVLDTNEVMDTDECECGSAPACLCATEKDVSNGLVSETPEKKHQIIRSTAEEKTPQETESAKELSHADTYLPR